MRCGKNSFTHDDHLLARHGSRAYAAQVDRSMKLLLSAYACEPEKGSEPGVGWAAAVALARSSHQVWVLTRLVNRTAIERGLAYVPGSDLHFVYYDLPGWTRWWKRGQRGVQFYYYLWQLGAYFVARRLHREIGFDLVHHVTFVKYWAPSFLALLRVPFIWGPVGGADRVPTAFWWTFGPGGAAFEAARDAARWLGEHDPFVLLTARRSALALAATAATAERLRKLAARDVRVFTSLGLLNNEIARVADKPHPAGNAVRFISIGNLYRWKGIHLGLRAFAASGLEEAEYWIVGDGPERHRLERLAEDLRVARRVTLWGRLPRAAALEKLGDAHVLVFPGLRDSGGMAWVEAMAMGRPVICLDLGGPGQLPDDSGVRIPARSSEQVVCDLAAAMRRLARDGELRLRMGSAGRRRSLEAYRWEEKVMQFETFYRQVVADNSEKGVSVR